MSVRTRLLALGTVAALSVAGTVVAVAPAQAAPTPTVTDTNLAACITDEVGLTGVLHALLVALGLGGVLHLLGDLDCAGDAITNINGLQGATSLTALDLDGNSILDLSPLKNLTVPVFSALNQAVTLAPIANGVSSALPVITDINGTVIIPTIATGAGLATGTINPVTHTVTWTSDGVGQLVFSAGQFAGTITRAVTSLFDPPYPVGTPMIAGSAVVGATLSTSGDASTTFQWKSNGTAIPGATASSYVPGFDDLDAALTVTATGAGTGYATASKTSVATTAVGVASPIPTVSGATSVGSTLTGDAGTWSPGVPLTYQWKRSTARSPHSIPGATGTTYVPTTADLGLTLTLWVTGTVDDNHIYTRSSASTAAVTKAVVPTEVPVPVVPSDNSAILDPGIGSAAAATLGTTTTTTTATLGKASVLKRFTRTPAPKIVGKALVGAKLSAKVGTWSKRVTFTYVWKANGKKLAKATHQSLVVTKKLVGKKLTVSVTGHLAGFVAATTSSAATKRVAPTS